MLARRTCRACGCWELHACDEGCWWIAADRCSACPDAALTLPINAAHVVHSTLEVIAEQNLPDGGLTRTYRAKEFPRLVITETTAQGVPEVVHVYVGALEVPRDQADNIAELLNVRSEAA